MILINCKDKMMKIKTLPISPQEISSKIIAKRKLTKEIFVEKAIFFIDLAPLPSAID